MATRFFAPLTLLAVLLPWLALAGRPAPTCTVEPITLAQLNAAIAVATPSTDEASVPPGVRPSTRRETDALRDVMAAFVACGDAGEPLRVLSLYTDRYLGELFYRQGLVTTDQYAEMARASPADRDERSRLLAVEDARLLADGRVAGEVMIRYAVIPTPKRFVVTIAEVDGVWLIDDVLGELTFALP